MNRVEIFYREMVAKYGEKNVKKFIGIVAMSLVFVFLVNYSTTWVKNWKFLLTFTEFLSIIY